MKQSFKTKLKQLWVPKPFRLPEPEFSKEQVDLLEELIQLIQPTVSLAASMSRDDRAYMAQFLVDLGTGIWRIRRKIESLGRMPKEIREALYSLESTWMSMSEGGVEIVDHIGTIPSSSEAVIVEVRSIANLAREQVVDALKPTILLKGEVIQKGEVIIGRPIKDQPIEEPRQLQVGVRSAFSQGDADEPVAEPDDAPMTSKVETFAMEMPVEMSEMPVREEELGAAVNRILDESTTSVADEILNEDLHKNDPVLDAVIGTEPTADEVAEAAPEQIEEAAETVVEEVAEAAEVEPAAEIVDEVVEAVPEQIEEAAEPVVDEVVEAAEVEPAEDIVEEVAEAVPEQIEETLEPVVEEVAEAAEVEPAPEIVDEVVEAVPEQIEETAEPVVEEVADVAEVEPAAEIVDEVVEAVPEQIEEAAEPVVEEVADVAEVGPAAEIVDEVVEAVPEQIEETAEPVVEEVAEAVPEQIEEAEPVDELSALDAELDEVDTASDNVLEEAQELLDAAGDGSDGGFVRDVPTPLDMAIAAEEAEKPKKKKKPTKTTKTTTAKKAKAEKIADVGDEKPKRRGRPKKASEDTDNG